MFAQFDGKLAGQLSKEDTCRSCTKCGLVVLGLPFLSGTNNFLFRVNYIEILTGQPYCI